MKRFFGIIIIFSLLVLAACGTAPQKAENSDNTAAEKPEATETVFEAVLAGIETKDIYGEDYKLTLPSEDYDLIMINIWGTYCGPCRVEMPELAKLTADLPERVLQLGLCIDGTMQAEAAKQIVESAGGTYDNILPSESFEKLLGKVVYIPTTVFLNSNGELVGEMEVGVPQGDVVEGYLSMINSRLEQLGK